jgi:hypothetical protein
MWVSALVDQFIHHGTPELDWQDIVESIKQGVGGVSETYCVLLL